MIGYYVIILYCIVLYCIVLYYIVLFYIILYYIILYYIILYYIILYYIISNCLSYRDKASDVVSVIEEARNLLIMDPEQCLGGWAVINLDEG